MKYNINVIGCSGCARAGKDTMVALLIQELSKRGKTAIRVALADPLKKFCDPFLKENFGVSAFTTVTAEKNLIRPLLVWFGDAKRKQTNGRFFIEMAEKSIQEYVGKFDFVIVSDVRYDFYEKDETYWLQKELGGTLIHVSRYTMSEPVTNKVRSPKMEKMFIQPANDHEMLNDPKVKKAADYKVEWPTIDVPEKELVTDPRMIKYAENIIKDRFGI